MGVKRDIERIEERLDTIEELLEAICVKVLKCRPVRNPLERWGDITFVKVESEGD